MSAGQLLGFALLGHSLFSLREYIHASRELGTHVVGIPSDIQLEALIGTAIVLLAATWQSAAKLKPLRLSQEHAILEAQGDNRYARLDTRPNFQDVLMRREHFLKWKKGDTGATDTALSDSGPASSTTGSSTGGDSNLAKSKKAKSKKKA